MSSTPKKAEETPKERLFAKYTGLAGIVSERTITAADFQSLGIDAPTVSFNRQNRFMVEVTDLDPMALEVLKGEDDISFTSSDNPRPVQVIEVGGSPANDGRMLPGQAGFTDGTPGAVTTATTGTAGNGSSTPGV